MRETYGSSPVEARKRHIILDSLRGLAILGICMANFPEFSLYSFLKPEAAAAMSTSAADRLVQYLLYFFIDGKFYTIFSLLFGIGFSIIITNVSSRGGNGLGVFYRRMGVLAIIGFIHLMTLWSGDILMLYALMGMLLPLFMRLGDRALLGFGVFFLFLPVVVDSVCEMLGVYPSAAIVRWQWYWCDKYGITDDNFAYWLRDSQSYGDVFKFLIQGAIVRMQEFVDGNRYFKVLGLFLIGYYVGRNRFYANLEALRPALRRIFRYGLCIGWPLTAIYSWSCINGHPLGEGVHSLFYFSSVYLTSFGYIAGIVLLYLKYKDIGIWRFFAAPGRMALTNYIGQSVIGIVLFYGIGFGIGATVGLIYVEIIAVGVFLFEAIASRGWLSVFRFGPWEWIWRCLTYGRLFRIKAR